MWVTAEMVARSWPTSSRRRRSIAPISAKPPPAVRFVSELPDPSIMTMYLPATLEKSFRDFRFALVSADADVSRLYIYPGEGPAMF